MKMKRRRTKAQIAQPEAQILEVRPIPQPVEIFMTNNVIALTNLATYINREHELSGPVPEESFRQARF